MLRDDLMAPDHIKHVIHPRANTGNPPVYKAIGITLAIASGLFIGTSFVLKKVGLLKANVKYNEEAGDGYGYLKNVYWWTGMTLMIIGEICNFVAYAFVDAILVTPLGALSVVVTTILSAIFLKERLSFVGKVGCFMCIIGSVIIVMNAPEHASVSNIQDMQHFVIAPGFLSYAGVLILGCTFVAFWAGPRYGKRSMLVYLTICSLIGGLSVVATQGLGAAVVAQAREGHQFTQWFLYVLLVFVVCTLLTEIIFLNKALNLFNAALVTPTYYVYFTSATIITSVVLFRGFAGTVVAIITVVMGFLVICSGVVLLQLSKSAKDVPDTAVFSGDLDQVRTVAEQAEPESEPKADAIRGTAAIIRRLSQNRQKMEIQEAKRVHDERLRDQMEPIAENEQVEWDGLRRRKTIKADQSGLQRRKTQHPPLGMTHFPDDWHDGPEETDGSFFHGSLLDSLRRRNQRKDSLPAHSRTVHSRVRPQEGAVLPQRPQTEIVTATPKGFDFDRLDTAYRPPHANDGDLGAMELNHVYGLPQDLRRPTSEDDRPALPSLAWADGVDEPRALQQKIESSDSSLLIPRETGGGHSARRQFSFQNPFSRHRTLSATSSTTTSTHNPQPVSNSTKSRAPSFKRRGTQHGSRSRSKVRLQHTEEERLGLVKGDGTSLLPNDTQHGTDYGHDVESLDDQNYDDLTPARRSSDELDQTQTPRPLKTARQPILGSSVNASSVRPPAESHNMRESLGNRATKGGAQPSNGGSGKDNLNLDTDAEASSSRRTIGHSAFV